VDGACRGDGYVGARASYGVFVSHYAEDLNRKGPVPALSPQTNQYAELFATMQALEVIHELIIAGEDLTHVIIKTDSHHVAQAMSSFIWKWTANGYRNWKGQPLMNGRAFKYVHEKVVLLEKEYGIRVSFYLVERRFNEQANALANAALNLN